MDSLVVGKNEGLMMYEVLLRLHKKEKEKTSLLKVPQFLFW